MRWIDFVASSMMPLVFLSILVLTTVCSAEERPDPHSTTAKALQKQYYEEINKYTASLRRKGELFLTDMGVNREYAASGALVVKVLLEQKVEYRYRISKTYYLGGKTTGSFDGIMIYMLGTF